jgi:hypothetical protein
MVHVLRTIVALVFFFVVSAGPAVARAAVAAPLPVTIADAYPPAAGPASADAWLVFQAMSFGTGFGEGLLIVTLGVVLLVAIAAIVVIGFLLFLGWSFFGWFRAPSPPAPSVAPGPATPVAPHPDSDAVVVTMAPLAGTSLRPVGVITGVAVRPSRGAPRSATCAG